MLGLGIDVDVDVKKVKFPIHFENKNYKIQKYSNL